MHTINIVDFFSYINGRKNILSNEFKSETNSVIVEYFLRKKYIPFGIFLEAIRYVLGEPRELILNVFGLQL